jgi:hypothetical protein
VAKGGNDHGSIDDLPWGAVFDPAANARALGAIQARGFRAATEVVDRLVEMASRNGAADRATEAASDATGSPSADAPPEAVRIIASWEKLVGQLTASLRGSTAARPVPATLDLVNGDTADLVYLEDRGGDSVATEVWLHNGGPEDMGQIRLRCSDLLANDGRVIGAPAVRFEPAVVPVPPRSSRGVVLKVIVAQDVQPGTYRGTVLADGHDDVWLPVVLTVRQRSV